MQAIKSFFHDIDDRWGGHSDHRVSLRIIGSTALMLQARYERATTDSDVLESAHLAPETKTRLLRLAGAGTELHKRHGMYIQILNEAIPFLPQVPSWRPVVDLDKLMHFDLTVLDIVDVVVSKLKRFHAKDSSDIAAMIDLGLVPHDQLVERFKLAADWFAHDARGEELPRYCANLNRIERDYLAVAETEIELPSWI